MPCYGLLYDGMNLFKILFSHFLFVVRIQGAVVRLPILLPCKLCREQAYRLWLGHC